MMLATTPSYERLRLAVSHSGSMTGHVVTRCGLRPGFDMGAGLGLPLEGDKAGVLKLQGSRLTITYTGHPSRRYAAGLS